MRLFRRATNRIESGSQVLADSGDVNACLKSLSEGMSEIIPSDLQKEVLALLGLSGGVVAASAGAAAPFVPFVILAGLTVCRIQAARQAHEEKTQDLRTHERIVTLLETLRERIEATKRDFTQHPTAAQLAEHIKQTIQQTVHETLKATQTELNLTDEEQRQLQTQFALFSADLLQLQDKIDLISDDVAHRPWLELRRPLPGTPNLFLYRDMAIPFVGRGNEWKQLCAFLESAQPFSWWRIIDAGGAGKSRMAQELCWHAFCEGWTAGFLQPTNPETWSRWRVTGDTLIVVDYVFARWEPAALGQILDQIARPKGPHKVRLLVLERNDSGPWWSLLQNTAGENAAHKMAHRETAADQRRYGDPLRLPPLGDDDLRTLLAFVLAERGIDPDEASLEGHVGQFRRLDPKGRPLFAAFYADAVSRDPQRPSWSLTDIAQSVLKQKILRKHPQGPGQNPVDIDARHLNLLVLATLVGGISAARRHAGSPGAESAERHESVSMADALAIEGLGDLLPALYNQRRNEWESCWDLDQSALLASYNDDFDDLNPYLPELQPDPLGEALVLARLAGSAIAIGEFGRAAMEATWKLLEAAGDLAPQYSSTWIDRAVQDYPAECSRLIHGLRGFQRVALWKEIPSDLSDWTRLHELVLTGTQVSDIDALKGLTTLRTLFLQLTQVSDTDALKGLTALQTLDLWGTQVSDIDALKGLTALRTLSLLATQVSDIDALKGLNALQALYLGGTEVSDIDALKGLAALRTLSLWRTQVSDIDTLKGLTALQELDLRATQVLDIAALKGLTALQTLDLEDTQVSVIDALKGLNALQTLNLGGTQVSDIAALKGLTALQTLDLEDTQVSDIDALKGLNALQMLNLAVTQVSDIDALKGLTALQTLNLAVTRVSDIDALKGLNALQMLNLAVTRVSDIDALKGLNALQMLNLAVTQVSDIDALKGLTALRTLYLSVTQVSDIDALKGLTALRTLNLERTQVSDIDALKDLTALQTLNLSDTQVSDIAALKGLTALQTLDLERTQVSDIAALKGLTALQKLWLHGTQVSDIDALKGLNALQALNLRDTQVSRDQVDWLRQQLPNCRIDF